MDQQLADVDVDVVDHAEKILSVRRQPFVRIERLVLGFCDVGPVRGVGGDIGEEGLARFPASVDPPGRLLVENIRAVPLRLHEGVVVQDCRVEVSVAGRVATGAGIGLPDAAAAMDENLVEAAVAGLILGFVAQVPFTEDAGGVTDGLQNLRERGRLQGESLTLQDGVGDAVLELVTAGQQTRPRRGAGGGDMKILKTHALGPQPVEVRRLEQRVAMRREVAVTLVVGQYEDNIRLSAEKALATGLCKSGWLSPDTAPKGEGHHEQNHSSYSPWSSLYLHGHEPFLLTFRRKERRTV